MAGDEILVWRGLLTPLQILQSEKIWRHQVFEIDVDGGSASQLTTTWHDLKTSGIFRHLQILMGWYPMLGIIVSPKGKEKFWRHLHKVKSFLNGLAIQKLAPRPLWSLQNSELLVLECIYTQASMPFLSSVWGSSKCWVKVVYDMWAQLRSFLPELWQCIQDNYNLQHLALLKIWAAFSLTTHHIPYLYWNSLTFKQKQASSIQYPSYCCSLYLAQAHHSWHKNLGSARG